MTSNTSDTYNQNSSNHQTTYNPNTYNSSKNASNLSGNQNSSKNTDNTTSIDTEYTCTTGVAAFNKNEMTSLSDNYANFGSVELNTDPCNQEFKFYTEINGKKILIGEDTRNILQEFKINKK